LAAIRASEYRNYELILVDDGSTDGSAAIGKAAGCQVIVINGRRGAAHCRNVGAAAARGEVLLSIDADVVIRPTTIRQAVQSLADGRWDAVFGSYTSETPAAGFFSQFHNLLHHYTHQHSQESAVTFWTGCGAVLRKAFDAVGGFDERHPPLEDLALGYALSAAGFRIRLNKQMQVTHLKQHSFLKLLRSYLFGRAVPWTRIMLAHRVFRSDLNTRPEHVLSVALVFLLPLSVLGAAWHWLSGVVALGTELGLLWANRNFLGFLRRQRGWWFAACGALQLHLFYIVCGVGAGGGLLSYWRFRRRYPERHRPQPSAPVRDSGGKSPATAIGLRGEYQSE
jgi:glycosyltransferase involved in cell wall biosynthesis